MSFPKPVLLLAAFAAAAFSPVSAGAHKPPKNAPKPPVKTAPAKAASLPKAETVLDKFVEVTGGKAAYAKITSTYLKTTVTFTKQGLSGTAEAYAKAPNKVYSMQTLKGIGTFEQGYDGTVGWSKDPLSGLRNLTGGELAQMQTEAVFNAPVRWRETFSKVEMLGVRKVGDASTYAIRLTDKKTGKTRTEYYDTKTGLELKSEAIAESPQGTLPTETYYSDYRVVDGIKLPFKSRGVFGGNEIVTMTTEVKNNLPIDDARFAKPAAPSAAAPATIPATPPAAPPSL